MKNPNNCIFEQAELDMIPEENRCAGDFILIPLTEKLKPECEMLRCMYKCVKMK